MFCNIPCSEYSRFLVMAFIVQVLDSDLFCAVLSDGYTGGGVLQDYLHAVLLVLRSHISSKNNNVPFAQEHLPLNLSSVLNFKLDNLSICWLGPFESIHFYINCF